MIEVGTKLSFHDIVFLVENGYGFNLGQKSADLIKKSRQFLETKISAGDIMYGVNTGFGKLANTQISSSNIEELQVNLIHSHSAGQGPEIPYEISRLAMFLLLNSVAKGYSGVRLETVKSLMYAVQKGLVPVSYLYGSLGASGDLAPLAHLVLGLMGENAVKDMNGSVYASILDADKNFPLIRLKAKEGLALINGTHFSTAYLIFATNKAISLFYHSLITAALSSEALKAIVTVYSPLIQKVRRHDGQIIASEIISKLLEGSEFIKKNPDEEIVQNPYSIRCTPQIMGGIYYSIVNAINVLNIEINSVTDNPLVFPDDGVVLSGGNFHGEPIGFAAEFLGLGLSKLASLSQVRTEKILNPAYNYGLPAFLVNKPGLNSGYMIAHYTQAALLNRVRLLSNPNISDNIPVSAMQEDIVSMSMNASSKAFEISELVEKIIAIELIIAIQALDLREKQENKKSSPILEKIRKAVREKIEFLGHDRIVKNDVDKATEMIKNGELINIVSKELKIGPLDIFSNTRANS